MLEFIRGQGGDELASDEDDAIKLCEPLIARVPDARNRAAPAPRASPAAAAARVETSSFSRMCSTCVATVRGLTCSRPRDRVDWTRRRRACVSTSISRRVSPSTCVARAHGHERRASAAAVQHGDDTHAVRAGPPSGGQEAAAGGRCAACCADVQQRRASAAPAPPPASLDRRAVRPQRGDRGRCPDPAARRACARSASASTTFASVSLSGERVHRVVRRASSSSRGRGCGVGAGAARRGHEASRGWERVQEHLRDGREVARTAGRSAHAHGAARAVHAELGGCARRTARGARATVGATHTRERRTEPARPVPSTSAGNTPTGRGPQLGQHLLGAGRGASASEAARAMRAAATFACA